MAIIDSELELLNLKIQHPEQFHKSEQQTFQSDLYILPKSKDLGIVALAEIAIALFFSKKIFQRNGKLAHLIQIADVFQKMFNCNFGNIYDQQEQIFDRKPFNRTKAIFHLILVAYSCDKLSILYLSSLKYSQSNPSYNRLIVVISFQFCILVH